MADNLLVRFELFVPRAAEFEKDAYHEGPTYTLGVLPLNVRVYPNNYTYRSPPASTSLEVYIHAQAKPEWAPSWEFMIEGGTISVLRPGGDPWCLPFGAASTPMVLTLFESSAWAATIMRADAFGEFLFNGELRLVVDILTGAGVRDEPQKLTFTPGDFQLKVLWDNDKYADVEFLMDSGTRFKCHRVVLAAQSSVMDKMFGGSFKEALEATVTVPGVADNTMRSMLEFMYTGKVATCNSEELQNVARLAEMYDLQSLVLRCGVLLANAALKQPFRENMRHLAQFVREIPETEDTKRLYKAFMLEFGKSGGLIECFMDAFTKEGAERDTTRRRTRRRTE